MDYRRRDLALWLAYEMGRWCTILESNLHGDFDRMTLLEH